MFKRFFLALIVILALMVSHTSAAGYSLSFDTSQGTLDAIYEGPASTNDLYLLLYTQNPQMAGPLLGAPEKSVLLGKMPPPVVPALLGKGKKTITDVRPGILYYATLATKNTTGGYTSVISTAVQITFGTKPVFSYTWPLEYNKQNTNTVNFFYGNIHLADYDVDTPKHIWVEFYYWPADDNNIGTGTIPSDAKGPFYARTGPSLDFPVGINLTGGTYHYNGQSGGVFSASTPGFDVTVDPGTYFFIGVGANNSLIPGKKYFYAQKIYIKNPDGTIVGDPEIKTYEFDSSKGYLTDAQKQNEFEKNSYRLLAPLPGLSVLLDPQTCLERLAQGVDPSTLFCSQDDPSGLNHFLNYAFRILIGAAAVFLVLRLIYEGYQYIVTDVPFLKASSKENIFTAFFGLLLALSAYLILNTINPKLVANDINIQAITLTPDDYQAGTDSMGIEIPTVGTQKAITGKTKSGKTITINQCDQSQMATVNAFGTTFLIQKNLVASVQRIDAKWRAMNPPYVIPKTPADKAAMGGYNCRTTAKGGRSYHSYGVAIDINPSSNPHQKELKTDFPPAFIQLWKAEGWGWGGDWSSSKDAMHFSKGKGEGGDMTFDDI